MTTCSSFRFRSCKNSKRKSNQSLQQMLKISAICIFTQAYEWFLKFTIDLQIVSCHSCGKAKSFHIFISSDFNSGITTGCGGGMWIQVRELILFTKQNVMTLTSLLSW